LNWAKGPLNRGSAASRIREDASVVEGNLQFGVLTVEIVL
jgi:hypothetical protein